MCIRDSSGIDHNLVSDRASRRGSASHDDGSALWGGMTLETLDGVADGVGYDIDNRLLQMGADIHRSDLGGGELVASLLFHHGEAEGELSQSGAAGPNIDLGSTGFGASLGWEDNDTGSYIEMTGLITDRRVTMDGLNIDGQGVHVALEAGTHVQFGERTQVTPLAQLVYGRSNIDSFEDATSGVHMKAGTTRNLRLRAGGQLAHAVNQDWTFEASAFVDLETEDSTDTFLPAGTPGHLELGGTGGELGLRMVGDLGGWQVFGGANARWAGGDDGADAVGAQIGVRRQF
ncbi:MAG: autotransporter outer membrane beta-barrel domain-containing protein [Gammaproteobacteria bacterium]|nr:autotransporter outer membrane beta-barrel domain-containing protein [Gammaproteobacteria bacterium]